MAYTSWSVVYGEQPSAAKWNILGTNDSYFYSFLGDNLAWQSWTPTLSGRFDNAKWTKTCKYIQIGKTVHFSFKLVASTTTPMSGGSTDAIFTLPVTAATGYTGTDQNALIGTGGIYDSGTGLYQATVGMNSSNYTSARIRFAGGSGGLEAITSTAPMTWTTSDEITVTGTYEAA